MAVDNDTHDRLRIILHLHVTVLIHIKMS